MTKLNHVSTEYNRLNNKRNVNQVINIKPLKSDFHKSIKKWKEYEMWIRMKSRSSAPSDHAKRGTVRNTTMKELFSK